MEPLPDGTHLIHIGPQKTGSTAIQNAMHVARDELLEHGVVYPGPDPRPRAAASVGLGFGRYMDRNAEMAAYDDLLAQLRNPSARVVCVSLEAFGRATDPQIDKIVTDLGGDAPHVVAVARRYDRLMPSQWQQRVKSGLRLSYGDWLDTVLGETAPDDPHWANFWVPHDTVTLMSRWAARVGRDNVTLIVGDESNRELLASSFEQLLAVPEGTLRSRGGRLNVSLDYPQTELVRRLNQLFFEKKWAKRSTRRLLRAGVVPALMNTADKDAQRVPPLPAAARARLADLSDARIEGLAELGIRIEGDLELLRVERDAEGSAELEAPAEISMESAVAALRGMARAQRAREEQRRKKRAGRAGRKSRRRRV